MGRLERVNPVKQEGAAHICCGWLLAGTVTIGWGSPTASAQECPPHYSMSVIYGPNCGSVLGIAHVSAWGINSNGWLCGDYGCPGGLDQAFVCSDGQTLNPIPFPGAMSDSRAVAINDRGVATGWYFDNNLPGMGSIGFLYGSRGFITILPPAGATSVEPIDVNSRGIVVGEWGNTGPGPYPLAFRWHDGAFQDISQDMPLAGLSRAVAISPHGLVTGWMGETPDIGSHAFIWDKGVVQDLGTRLLDAFSTEGRAINDQGHACGIWWRASGMQFPPFERHGFFYDGKRMSDLGTLPFHPELFAVDMNNSDQIVGYAAASGFVRAILWQNGNLYPLSNLIVSPLPGIVMHGATAIAEDGSISATGVDQAIGKEVGIRLTPLPPRIGDTNCDYRVNVDDLLSVIATWGVCPTAPSACAADIDRNGVVDQWDLIDVCLNWG